jgi:hypothetical protein
MRGWTHVPGFWSVKGVSVTVLTLMAAERIIYYMSDGFGDRNWSEGGGAV